jgi:hypothetical protein
MFFGSRQTYAYPFYAYGIAEARRFFVGYEKFRISEFEAYALESDDFNGT